MLAALSRRNIISGALAFCYCWTRSHSVAGQGSQIVIPTLRTKGPSALFRDVSGSLRELIGTKAETLNGKIIGSVWDFVFDPSRSLTSLVLVISGLPDRWSRYNFLIPYPQFQLKGQKVIVDDISGQMNAETLALFVTPPGMLSAKHTQIDPNLGYVTLFKWDTLYYVHPSEQFSGPFGTVLQDRDARGAVTDAWRRLTQTPGQ